MKKFDFHELLGNEGFKQQAESLFSHGRYPGAAVILGEDGCGRNFAARLLAHEYLDDKNGLVQRGIHPDCVNVEGEGASGQITVARVRAATYELNKSAVMADGVRVALVRDAHFLNRYSANALLKTLEQPPKGVLFILTARRESDLLSTVLSRCVRLRVSPLGVSEAVSAAQSINLGLSGERAAALGRMFGGKLGLVLKTASDRDKTAMAAAAEAAFKFVLAGDKLSLMAELDRAQDRTQLKRLLFCLSSLCLGGIRGETAASDEFCRNLIAAYNDIDKNINLKLLCAKLAAGL